MIGRSVAFCTRLLAWLVASAVVLGAVGLWLLMREPIDLDRVSNHLVAVLSDNEAGIRVEIEDTRLRLGPDRSLGLLVTRLRGVGETGEELFSIREAEVDLSLRALLFHQTFAPSTIVAREPRLTLVRGEDGGFALEGVEGGETGVAAGIDPALIIERARAEPDGDEPLSFLRRLSIEDARITLEDPLADVAYDVEDVELDLARDPDAIELSASASLDRRDHSVTARLDASLPADGDALRYGLRVGDLEPGDAAPFLDLAGVDLGAFRVRADVLVDGSISIDGVPGPAEVTLTSRDGSVVLPDLFADPVEVDVLDLDATVDPMVGRAEITRLAVEAHRASFDVSGHVAMESGGLAAAIHLDGGGIERAELERLWPIGVGANARDWVIANILEGRVARASIDFVLEPGDLDRSVLRDEALSGWYEAEGVTVRYFDTMPPIVGASGRATLTGQSMGFEITGGGVGDLRILDADVMIDGIGYEGPYTTQLELVSEIDGPLDQVLALIDRPPLGFPSDLGIDPAGTAGLTKTRLRLGLPIYRKVRNDEVRIAAESAITEASIANLDGQFDIDEAALALDVTIERMILSGAARIEGVPSVLRVQENFEGDAPDTEFQLEAAIDRPTLSRLIGTEELPVGIDGVIDARIEGIQDDGRQRLDLALDLERTILAVPEIGYTKAEGQPGTLGLVAEIADGDPVSIQDIVLRTADLNVDADLSLEADTYAFERLIVDDLRYRRSRLSGVVARRESDYVLAFDAPSLDLMPLIEGGALDGGEGDGADDDAPIPINFNLRAERLLYEGRALRDTLIRFERDEVGLRSGLVRATLPNGSAARLDLVPDGPDQTLLMTTDDAGALFRYFGETGRIEGGAFRLDARVLRQEPTTIADGTLQITDFTLRDAPIIARILTLASFRGISNLVGGQGIYFNRLNLPFRLADRKLTLEEGRMSGSQIGFTADGTVDLDAERFDLRGTVVPIYTLNRIIGKIPLIGAFLTGAEGEGAFAVTFKVRGGFDDPNITVNPLSVLAPGFVRDLFRGIRNGTLEAPEVQPDTD